MKIKIIIQTLVLIIGLWACNDKPKSKDYTLINAVPTGASIIIETESLEQLQHKLQETNTWKQTQKLSFNQSITQFFLETRKIIPAKDFNQNFILSISLSGSKSFDYLLIKYVHDTEEKEYKTRLQRYYQITQTTYDGVNLYKLQHENELLYYAMYNNIMMLSHEKLLVEEAIRQLRSKISILSNPEFKNLYESIDLSKDANIFIQYKDLHLLAENYFPNSDTSWLRNHADWSALELVLNDEGFSLKGNTLADYGKASLLTSYKDLEPQDKEILELLPASVAAFTYSAIDDIEHYTKQYERYLNSRQILYQKQKNIERYPYKNNPIKAMQAWIGHEMVLAYISEQTNRNFNELLLIQTKDSILAKKNIRILSNKQLTYRKQVIYQLAHETLLEDVIGQYATDFKYPYVMQYQGVTIWANSQAVLQNYIDEIQLNRRYMAIEANQKLIAKFDKQAHIFAVATGIESLNLLQAYLKPDILAELQQKTESLNHFAHIAYQLRYDTPYTNTQIELETAKTPNVYAKIIGSYSFEHAIKRIIPVQNHETKQKELLVQDAMHHLYLFTTGGKLLWVRDLDNPIIGNISQIDNFNNGRLQYIFNTETQIYILDRKGNNVTPFPIQLPQIATAGIGVFDYNQKHQYRIIVPMGNQLKAYVTNGNKLNGFQTKTFDGTINKIPIYVKNTTKDYIITATDAGEIIILDRTGKQQFIPNTRFNPQGTLQYMNSQIQFINKPTQLIKISLQNQITKEDLDTDIQQLQLTSQGLIQKTANEINWINTHDISHELIPTHEYTFNYYIDNQQQFLSLIDNTNRQIQVIDKENKILLGMPVFGEINGIIFQSLNSYYLATQSNIDNTLLIYRLQ